MSAGIAGFLPRGRTRTPRRHYPNVPGLRDGSATPACRSSRMNACWGPHLRRQQLRVLSRRIACNEFLPLRQPVLRSAGCRSRLIWPASTTITCRPDGKAHMALRVGPKRPCCIWTMPRRLGRLLVQAVVQISYRIMHEAIGHVEHPLPPDVGNGRPERTRVCQEPAPRAAHERPWRKLIDPHAIHQLDRADQAAEG